MIHSFKKGIKSKDKQKKLYKTLIRMLPDLHEEVLKLLAGFLSLLQDSLPTPSDALFKAFGIALMHPKNSYEILPNELEVVGEIVKLFSTEKNYFFKVTTQHSTAQHNTTQHCTI